jgi:basic membrane protein A
VDGADHDPGYLLSGTRLRDYEQWAATATMQLTDHERVYLDASARQRDDAMAREAQRRRSERQLAASARRRLWAVAAMVAAFVVAGGALVLRVVGTDPPRVVAETSRLSDEQEELVSAGLDRAARELGVTVEQMRRRSGDVAEDYRALADGGADLVFIDPEATGRDIEAAIAAHPETMFVTIGAADPPDGAYAVTFADEHAGYLAGIAAATTTSTRVIGFVGDRQDLDHERLRAGFEAGAHRVDDDVTILATYIGQASYGDSLSLSRANAAADKLYERGADVVFAATGDASSGVFEAALDRTLAAGRDVFAIGAESDRRSTAPGHLRDHIRASALRRWDVAVFDTVQTLVDGDRSRGVTELTAADGALTLAAYGTQRVHAAADDAIDDIRAGRVAVPSVPTGALTAPPGEEVVGLGTVTWDGRRCAAEDVPVDIPSGATLRVAFDNPSDGPGALIVTHDLGGTQLTAVAPAGANAVGYAVARTGTLDVSCRSVVDSALSDEPAQRAAIVEIRSR